MPIKQRYINQEINRLVNRRAHTDNVMQQAGWLDGGPKHKEPRQWPFCLTSGCAEVLMEELECTEWKERGKELAV